MDQPASVPQNADRGSERPEGEALGSPPTGEYREAFAGIDAIDGMSDPSGSARVDDQPAKRESQKPEPKPESKPDAKPDGDKAPAQPGKRKLNPDVEAAMKGPDKKDAHQDGKAKPDDGKSQSDPFDAPETPKSLREAYKRVREESETRAAKLKELEEKLPTVEKEVAERVRKEYEPRLSASEKRRAELEEEMRFSNYERTEEFNKQYHTPLVEAWKAVGSSIEGIIITDSEGKEREATLQDVVALTGMANPQARAKAHELFGTAAPEIMQHRANILRLTGEKQKAIDTWRQEGSKRDEAMQAQKKASVQRWSSELDGYAKDYPDLYGRRESDPEGNEMLDRGDKLIRLAFLAEGLPDGLTTQQRHEAHLESQVEVSARAKAFPRVVRDLTRAKGEIEALKKRLAEYESSEPGPGGRDTDRSGGSSGGGAYKTPEEEIDAMPGIGR